MLAEEHQRTRILLELDRPLERASVTRERAAQARFPAGHSAAQLPVVESRALERHAFGSHRLEILDEARELAGWSLDQLEDDAVFLSADLEQRLPLAEDLRRYLGHEQSLLPAPALHRDHGGDRLIVP